jgi:ribonuclease G
MTTEILINSRRYEARIALVEQGNLTEFHLQRPTEKGFTGNIYLGRVVRVLPGMQAAFVDIGLERTGFLYVDDVFIPPAELPDTHSDGNSAGNGSVDVATSADKRRPQYTIEELLREGQPLIVQVSKDPIGTKGARLTCQITLPGRNLVFIPYTEHIGISRKIEDEEKKEALRAMIERLRPKNVGFIVRTVAENLGDEEIEADMEFLMLLWEEIKDRAQSAQYPLSLI